MSSQDTIIVHVDPDLEEIIPQFLLNQQKALARMQAALCQQDYATLQNIGHAIKGSAGGYGFDVVTDMGRAIEHAAQAGNHAEIASWLQSLAQYLARVQVVYA